MTTRTTDDLSLSTSRQTALSCSIPSKTRNLQKLPTKTLYHFNPKQVKIFLTKTVREYLAKTAPLSRGVAGQSPPARVGQFLTVWDPRKVRGRVEDTQEDFEEVSGPSGVKGGSPAPEYTNLYALYDRNQLWKSLTPWQYTNLLINNKYTEKYINP